MDMFLYPLLMLVALAIFAAFLKKHLNASDSEGESPASSGRLGYRQKGALFTPAERSFFGVLQQAIDTDKYRIFGKVRVADLIQPQPSKNHSQWHKAFNSIKAKHFDFVICKADDLSPVVTIELDDKSHNTKKRQQRDELLDDISQQAALPLIRVSVTRAYNVAEVAELVNKRLETGSFSATQKEISKETSSVSQGKTTLVAER